MDRYDSIEEGVTKEGIKELEYAVRNLGMQRVLYELATIINSYDKSDFIPDLGVIPKRHRYSSQFSHDLHHTTAGDRNELEEPFKMRVDTK